MKRVLGFGLWVLGTLALASCAGAPSYPDPQPGYGQILVKLTGVPREGVKGPRMQDTSGAYSTERRSVEQGKDFERVDYDAIEDVVVVVDAGSVILTDVPLRDAEVPLLTITREGLDHLQIASGMHFTMRRTASRIRIKNERATALTLYGLSAEGQGFEVTVPASGEESVIVLRSGVYDILCDEDEALHCRWITTTTGYVWQGDSAHAAFFDYLAPADYELSVYAPRLPDWTGTVNVLSAKRSVIDANLTVNDLPKVRR
jgi:hypothetical protein